MKRPASQGGPSRGKSSIDLGDVGHCPTEGKARRVNPGTAGTNQNTHDATKQTHAGSNQQTHGDTSKQTHDGTSHGIPAYPRHHMAADPQQVQEVPDDSLASSQETLFLFGTP